jgi:hypothetical protein
MAYVHGCHINGAFLGRAPELRRRQIGELDGFVADISDHNLQNDLLTWSEDWLVLRTANASLQTLGWLAPGGDAPRRVGDGVALCRRDGGSQDDCEQDDNHHDDGRDELCGSHEYLRLGSGRKAFLYDDTLGGIVRHWSGLFGAERQAQQQRPRQTVEHEEPKSRPPSAEATGSAARQLTASPAQAQGIGSPSARKRH